jgi:hypothetical protein
MNLLSKDKFQWAKNFLSSSAWQMLQHEENNSDGLQFTIPFQCPKAKPNGLLFSRFFYKS